MPTATAQTSLHLSTASRTTIRRLRDYEASRLGQSLQPRGKIGRVADDRLFLRGALPDEIADDDDAGRSPGHRPRLQGGRHGAKRRSVATTKSLTKPLPRRNRDAGSSRNGSQGPDVSNRFRPDVAWTGQTDLVRARDRRASEADGDGAAVGPISYLARFWRSNASWDAITVATYRSFPRRFMSNLRKTARVELLVLGDHIGGSLVALVCHGGARADCDLRSWRHQIRAQQSRWPQTAFAAGARPASNHPDDETSDQGAGRGAVPKHGKRPPP